jgi:hypothetical protein
MRDKRANVENVMLEVESVHVSASCNIAVYQSVLLQHWFGAVSIADAQATLVAHERARANTLGRVFVFVVVDEVPGIPSFEIRKKLTGMAQQTEGEVEAHATVIRSSGFLASTLRSVVATIFSFARTTYPRRVFANVAEAGEWLATHRGSPPAAALVEAFETIAATHVPAQRAD